MGMGGAFVGLADDRNAVLWNPAGMLKLEGSGISFMWAKQLGFIPYNYISYCGGISEHKRIGGAVIYSGDEVLSETTALLSYASSLSKISDKLNKIAWALNVKIRWASFGNNSEGDPDRVTGDAFGYGVDLGLMWCLSEKISLGMLWRDLYNDITWNSSTSGEYSESTPTELTFGASYRPFANSVMALDVRKALYSDVEDRLLLGVEQNIFKIIYLRAGWGQNIGAKYRNQDIAVGFGISQAWKRLQFGFDFAYMLNDLQNTPRTGMTLNW
jgi:long-subunit fatty acid transport protein